MKIKICELFRGIQGEGINTGKPYVFVRLSGCNKRCIWSNGSCDTKFASFQAVDYEEITTDELIQRIRKFKCKDILFTGGEPCMQAEALIDIMQQLQGIYTFSIETNGSIYSKDLVNLIDFWSISPKLPSSGNKTFEQDKFAIKSIIQSRIDIDYQLKFVIDTSDIERDLKDVKNFMMEVGDKNCNLIFQPEGLTEDLNEYAKRGAKLAEYFAYDNWFEWLDNYNWRIMIQNHRVWWNNRRRM